MSFCIFRSGFEAREAGRLCAWSFEFARNSEDSPSKSSPILKTRPHSRKILSELPKSSRTHLSNPSFNHPVPSYFPILPSNRPPQNSIPPLLHPLIPPPTIILIDPLNQAILPNLDQHANMTNELLPTRLDGDLSVRPHDVVRASTAPYLLDYCACRGWVDGLCVIESVFMFA